jgi:hypothetical protein
MTRGGEKTSKESICPETHFTQTFFSIYVTFWLHRLEPFDAANKSQVCEIAYHFLCDRSLCGEMGNLKFVFNPPGNPRCRAIGSSSNRNEILLLTAAGKASREQKHDLWQFELNFASVFLHFHSIFVPCISPKRVD